MNQKTRTPTPAELAAQTPTGQPSAEDLARMSSPLDVGANYRISGQTLVGLYQIIDEIPMKYARQLLPAIQMNIERIEEAQE